MKQPQIMLALSDRAMTYIKTSATERKRGEFVTQIIEQYMDQQAGGGKPETGILERIELKLDRVLAGLEHGS
ncbi:MAG: hypothetical protein U0350_02525 [Caldilineaceae bacterium]